MTKAESKRCEKMAVNALFKLYEAVDEWNIYECSKKEGKETEASKALEQYCCLKFYVKGIYDMLVTMDFEHYINKFAEYAENYDEIQECVKWIIDAKTFGYNINLTNLVEHCEYIGKKLINVAERLEALKVTNR